MSTLTKSLVGHDELSTATTSAARSPNEPLTIESGSPMADWLIFAIVACSSFIVGNIALAVSLQTFEILRLSVLIATLTGAAYTDVSRRIIRNRLVIVGFIAGLSSQLSLMATSAAAVTLPSRFSDMAGLASFTTLDITSALLGTSLCLGVMCVIRLLAGCGGGDVKLAAVIGSIVGWEHGLLIIMWCHICAGVFAVCAFGYFKAFSSKTPAANVPTSQSALSKQNAAAMTLGIPMAPFFLFATLMVLTGVIQP